jgi:hypothetical protein
VYISGLPDSIPVPTNIWFNADKTIGTLALDVKPFTISVYQLDIQPGGTMALYSIGNGNQRLAYRRADA